MGCANWLKKYSYDIIWGYQVILSTVTTLGFLMLIYKFGFTLGSQTKDLFFLSSFPTILVIWEWCIYFGKYKKSVVTLVILGILNLGPYSAALYAIWFILTNEVMRSTHVFCYFIFAAYSTFIIISEAYLAFVIYHIIVEIKLRSERIESFFYM